MEHSEAGVPDLDTSHPLKAGAPVRSDSPTFAEFGVREEITRALTAAGIERTFAIQELTLPLAMAGEDIIGQARTGTGKTLGFGVPLLHRVQTPGDGTPQVLVVVPTRELCLQVTHDLTDAGKHLGVRILAIYGGRPYEQQISALRKGVDVVIGTPGRLLDLAEQRHLVLGKVRGLVLDGPTRCSTRASPPTWSGSWRSPRRTSRAASCARPCSPRRPCRPGCAP
jgi:superfamily II DNA/RNA helicase